MKSVDRISPWNRLKVCRVDRSSLPDKLIRHLLHTTMRVNNRHKKQIHDHTSEKRQKPVQKSVSPGRPECKGKAGPRRPSPLYAKKSLTDPSPADCAAPGRLARHPGWGIVERRAPTSPSCRSWRCRLSGHSGHVHTIALDLLSKCRYHCTNPL